MASAGVPVRYRRHRQSKLRRCRPIKKGDRHVLFPLKKLVQAGSICGVVVAEVKITDEQGGGHD